MLEFMRQKVPGPTYEIQAPLKLQKSSAHRKHTNNSPAPLISEAEGFIPYNCFKNYPISPTPLNIHHHHTNRYGSPNPYPPSHPSPQISQNHPLLTFSPIPPLVWNHQLPPKSNPACRNLWHS